MSVVSELKKSLYASISPLFPDATIIYSHQNGTEPITPYLSLDIQSFDAIGQPETSTLVDSDGMQRVKRLYEVKVRFVWVGKEDQQSLASNLSLALDFSFDKSAVINLLLKNNLSYLRRGIIKKLGRQRETEWFTTYQQDVVFSFLCQEDVNTLSIDYVRIEDLLKEDEFWIPSQPPYPYEP